jgi:hypothetical protein
MAEKASPGLYKKLMENTQFFDSNGEEYRFIDTGDEFIGLVKK